MFYGLCRTSYKYFQKLIQIGNHVDAAIFIFSEDDLIFNEQQETYLRQTRDNVLFEFGLFVGILNYQNVIICKQGHIKMPTDLSGLIYADLAKEHTAKLKIKNWLDSLAKGTHSAAKANNASLNQNVPTVTLDNSKNPETILRNYRYTIKNLNVDLANHVKFGCLLIRYGSEEQIGNSNLTSIEGSAQILKNRDIYGFVDPSNQLEFIIPLEIHTIFGSEVKFFVETDSIHLNDLLQLIKNDDQFDDVQMASANSQRIYFLLKEFDEVRTWKGLRNNFIYPK